jgi:hypothetical protein
MTQASTVLRHLRNIGPISPRDALDNYGISRLAARVLDLKEDGYIIATEMRTNPATGLRYARYTLSGLPVVR